MKKIVKQGLCTLALVPFVAAFTVQASEYDGVNVVPSGTLEAAAEKEGEADKARQQMLIQLYKERKQKQERKVINPVEKTEKDSEVTLDLSTIESIDPKRNWRPSARYYLEKKNDVVKKEVKAKVKEEVVEKVEVKAGVTENTDSVTTTAASVVETKSSAPVTETTSGISEAKLIQVESILKQAKAGTITDAQFNASLLVLSQK